jgi:hypothetical protein
MTITLNTDYDVTLNTALLGYVGETNARPVSVKGMEVDGADRYVLTIDYGDGTAYEVDITGGQWTPTADILRSAQTISCQICAKKLSGQEYILVKKSRIFRLRIGAAIGDTAIPSPDVAVDALDRIDAIGRQAHADMQTAVTAAETATTMANNAAKSATAAEKSADTATQAAERAETAKTAAETSATQADAARQGAETARAEAVTAQNTAKISAAQAATSAQQTTADKNITAGYAKTAKTAADSTTADRQAVQEMATQVTADKATVAENAAQVATDRKAAETAAQTAQAVADSLPEDYVTAVSKIAENTAEIGRIKLTDKELTRRVNALYDIGQGVTHRFETDTDTAYAKTVPTGGKLMSVKSVGGRSIVWNQLISQIVEKTSNGIATTKIDSKSLHISGTSSAVCFIPISPVQTGISNHKYLFHSHASDTTALSSGTGFYNDNGGNRWHEYGKGIIFTMDGNGTIAIAFRVNSNITVDFSITPQIYDLTAMFGSENEPTSVEEFEEMFPADYYPYCAGEVVSAGVESVVEQGRNLWDEVWGVGSINASSGNDEGSKEAIYSKNYTPIIPNSTYIFVYAGSAKIENVKTRFYDHNKKYIGYNDNNGQIVYPNKAFITPLNAFYVRFTLPPDYGNVYKNDIALIADSSGTYVPYHRNEHPIPEAIKALPGYGWSAGTARNYVDYENKRYVQCVSSVDLGTLNWVAGDSGKVGFQTSQVTGQKLTKNYNILPNIICSKYLAKTQNAMWGKTSVTGITTNASVDGYVYVNDTSYTDATAFKQAMQGVILYYELATPIVTDISSLIPDDFLRNIEVEAGGSITFKNSNDSYRIPVPSEEEYIVKLSEVGGTT